MGRHRDGFEVSNVQYMVHFLYTGDYKLETGIEEVIYPSQRRQDETKQDEQIHDDEDEDDEMHKDEENMTETSHA
ncbi:hypothetical protein IL306_012945 [Fusarium sp. DS 682]|nr:hypothetical protein IL306_012945 [Fusarium sp. DS 682]